MAEKLSVLTSRQHKAIAALLKCRNVAEAAQHAKVGERTLYRWMQEPQFVAALRASEGTAIDVATRRLIYLQEAAIGVITIVLDDGKVSAAVRLRAAQTVLDSLLKLRELRNVEDRLIEMQAQINTLLHPKVP